MSFFEKAFDDLIKIEGGYSDHPSDKGRKTKFGITEFVARENDYKGDMKELPLETAKDIYKTCYWNKMRLDDIAKLSSDIAHQLFQCAVNMGTGTTLKMLQRALNCKATPSLNKLNIDGIMGPKTLITLGIETGNLTDNYTILTMLKAQQIMRYMEIVEKDASQSVFLKGWLKRVQG
jgi:lysozyme family protein